MIGDAFKFRGEFQVPESLPMCAADRTVTVDVAEAFRLGQQAVRLAVRGESGLMTTIVRRSSKPYKTALGTIPLNKVAAKTKPLPKNYIAAGGMMVTEAFRAYVAPLIGPLPQYARLRFHPVR